MANRNGMGPANQGPLTGRGLGNCTTGSNIGKIGLGIGALGMAWGCRRGLGRGLGRGYGVRGGGLGRGFFQAAPVDTKETLTQYKEQLKQELASIEEQLTSSEDE